MEREQPQEMPKTPSELFAIHRANVVDIPQTLESIAANMRANKLGEVVGIVMFAQVKMPDGSRTVYPFQAGTQSKIESIGMVECAKAGLLK